MFDFFDNRDKCHKPGFLRGTIYTSCISMVLLDQFANKSNTFQQFSLSPSLPFPPWVSTSSDPGFQDCAINGTLLVKQSTYRIRVIVPNCIELNTGFGIYIDDAAEGQRSWWRFSVDLYCLCGIFRTLHICSTWSFRQKQKTYVFKQ